MLELQPNDYTEVKREPHGSIKKEKKFFIYLTKTHLAGICTGTLLLRNPG